VASVIPCADIERLRRLSAKDEGNVLTSRRATARHSATAGHMADVVDGPFKFHRVKVEEIIGHKARGLLHMSDRMVPIEIPLELLAG
jgi:transcription antitermination factor NusG